MGRASGMADALRCLEFDVACYQDRIARSAAYFLCGYPFSHRDHCPFCRIRRASGLVTAASFRLSAAGFYWPADVCAQLWPAFLGRIARFLWSGSGVTGDHPDLRHSFRASNASRRTTAAAQTSGRTARARRRSNDLRAPSWFQRLHGVLGRAWYHFRRGRRGVFERLAQSAGGQLAPAMIAAWQMIFGAAPLLLIGFVVEGNPLKFHWSVLSICCLLYLAVIGSALTFLLLYWLLPRMTVAATGDLADHATWRSRVRLGSRRRDIFPVVAAWRVPGAGGCVDDFSKKRRGGAGDPRRLERLSDY